MGSPITLRLGNLEVDWGKNNVFTDHGALFRPDDRSVADYIYVDDNGELITESKEALSRRLRDMTRRLALLGHTTETARVEYADLLRSHQLSTAHPAIAFERFLGSLVEMEVTDPSLTNESEYDFGELGRQMIDRLGLPVEMANKWTVGQLLENFSPWSVLTMLAQNPRNLDLEVTWRVADVIEGGWVNPTELVVGAGGTSRFLIVTEGSSDSAILNKALTLRCPDIADFFTFVDMQDGYPFTGTGNLFRFCQGLVSIGVSNKVIVVFDNDAAGIESLERVKALRLPANMRAIALPDLELLQSVSTDGPSGPAVQSINGQAASIECYLDVPIEAMRVRWTNYVTAVHRYQGELTGAAEHVRRFLSLTPNSQNYDFSRIDAVLDSLVEAATRIATS